MGSKLSLNRKEVDSLVLKKHGDHKVAHHD